MNANYPALNAKLVDWPNPYFRVRVGFVKKDDLILDIEARKYVPATAADIGRYTVDYYAVLRHEYSQQPHA